MKVQLVVVQGKPEGKIIPLLGPVFKIGRGETCHLRPNSELVSREHAEFTIGADTVVVRDLGSRNGTLVNGKALTESCQLKDRDLVQVGNLTFAVSIQGAPVVAAKAPTVEGAVRRRRARRRRPRSPPAPASRTTDRIVAGRRRRQAQARRPSGVYGGETVSISTIKPPPAARRGQAPRRAQPPPAPAPASAGDDDEYLRAAPRGGRRPRERTRVSNDTEDGGMIPEEFLDESNPFFVKKKPAAESKPAYKDTSDAASDILKKMMDRRRKPS